MAEKFKELAAVISQEMIATQIYSMWLNVLKKYGFACAVNEPLLKYRLTASGKSGSKLKSAGMTYRVYRYAGFPVPAALVLFGLYAVNGVLKYSRAYLGKKLHNS